MRDGTALRRALLGAAALATLFAAQGALAQLRVEQAIPDERSVSPAELAVDRKLAEQYAAPAPVALPNQLTDAAPVVLPAGAGFDDAATASLEKEIEAALAEAAADNKKKAQPARHTFVTAPSAWSTAGLVTGALALLALVSLVLTLAVRELRQDAKQRRGIYRRRVRRREPAAPATASAG